MMASLTELAEIMAFTLELLLLLLTANKAMEVFVSPSFKDDEAEHLSSYITEST